MSKGRTCRSTTPCCASICAQVLARLAAGAGSAGRVARLILCAEPPSLDAGEITDKGYVNQRVVLDRRADVVERLYRDEPDPAVIAPASSDISRRMA